MPFVPPALPPNVDAVNLCGLLTTGVRENSFQNCLDVLGEDHVTHYHDACAVDVAVGADSCPVLNAMVGVCRDNNVAVNPDWRVISGCSEFILYIMQYYSAKPTFHFCFWVIIIMQYFTS